MNAPRSCALIACLLFSSLLAVAEEAWITSWTVSPELAEPAPKRRIVNLEDQTVRELVRISVGGSQIRVHLSNECDTSPLVVCSATGGDHGCQNRRQGGANGRE